MTKNRQKPVKYADYYVVSKKMADYFRKLRAYEDISYLENYWSDFVSKHYKKYFSRLAKWIKKRMKWELNKITTKYPDFEINIKPIIDIYVSEKIKEEK